MYSDLSELKDIKQVTNTKSSSFLFFRMVENMNFLQANFCCSISTTYDFLWIYWIKCLFGCFWTLSQDESVVQILGTMTSAEEDDTQFQPNPISTGFQNIKLRFGQVMLRYRQRQHIIVSCSSIGTALSRKRSKMNHEQEDVNQIMGSGAYHWHDDGACRSRMCHFQC